MTELAATRRDPTRRNVLLLASCQALAMSGSSLVATVAALVGFMLAEDKSLATLPVACQFLATMSSTIPASLLMRRIGRRAGFTTGQCIGFAGTTAAALAIYYESFTGFVCASAVLGVHNAFWQYYRFAAADTATVAYRSRAISFVLAGGVIAAIVGPELAKASVGLFDPVRYAGNYACVAVLILCAICVLQFLDIPPLTAAERQDSERPLKQIAAQPAFIVAAMSAMFGYAIMVLAMTATPLAMVHDGLSFADTAFVIEWHILGMFVPSFFTGHLISRFGVLNIITFGIVLMSAAVLVSTTGNGLLQFWAGLVLIGLGWNCMFVGGSTLLTECYTPAERAKVQALNDFLVFSAVAGASFSSGQILHYSGWAWINFAMLGPMTLVLLATIWLRLWQGRARIAA